MNNIQKGLEIVKLAVQYDFAGKNREAIEHYKLSLEYFERASQEERDPNKLSQLRAKMYEYSQRALTLSSLEQAQQQPLNSFPSPLSRSTSQISHYNSTSPSSNQPQNTFYSLSQPLPTDHSSLPPSYVKSNSTTSLSKSDSATSPFNPNLSFSPFQTTKVGSTSQNNFIDNSNNNNNNKSESTPKTTSNTSTHSSNLPPLITRYAIEFPKHLPNLQAALDILEEGKKEDTEKNYQEALDYYTDAMERLLKVYQAESNPESKKNLYATIDSFMKRAQFLKEIYQLTPNRVDNLITDVTSLSSTFTPSPSPAPPPPTLQLVYDTTRTSNSDLNRNRLSQPQKIIYLSEVSDPNPPMGKMIQIANETKSLLGRQKLVLSVSLQSNLVYPKDRIKLYVKVDNRSGMVVNLLRVILRKIERTLGSETPTLITNVVEVTSQDYTQGTVFPLPGESNYSGELIFGIPYGLRPTNLYQPGVLEREYDLTVECDLSFQKNLKVRFPITIGRTDD